MTEDTEARIRERAHLIWEREGRPEGREQDHWNQAAAEIAAESETPAEPEARAAAPVKRAARKPKPAAEDGAADPAPKRRAPAKPKSAKAGPETSV